MVNHIVCSILRYVQQFIYILLAIYFKFKEEMITLKELLDIIRQETQKYYEQNHHFFKRRNIFAVHNLALKNLNYNHSNHHSTLSCLNISLCKRRSLRLFGYSTHLRRRRHFTSSRRSEALVPMTHILIII